LATFHKYMIVERTGLGYWTRSKWEECLNVACTMHDANSTNLTNYSCTKK